MRKLFIQVIKFGVVGASAFVVDYSIMLILTEFFDVHYLFSSTISFIIALIFNYILSMRFVFKSREQMHKGKEFVIFCLLSVIGLGINQLLMWLLVEKMLIHYAITKIFATAVVMMWNFITRKIFLEEH